MIAGTGYQSVCVAKLDKKIALLSGCDRDAYVEFRLRLDCPSIFDGKRSFIVCLFFSKQETLTASRTSPSCCDGLH